MKRFLWFFPYFLTNVLISCFFVTWCFLVHDAYLNPLFRPTLYTYSKLFACLLLLCVPRYLIKGKVPEPFNKGIKSGTIFVIKYALIWAVFFLFLRITKSSENLLFLYQANMIFCFILGIYAHFRWGKLAKKAET